MTNIVSAPHVFNSEATSTFTLSNGSKEGRLVIALAGQFSSFTSLDEISLDGVSAAFPCPIQISSGGNNRALVGVWENSALPASAGSYEMAIDHHPGVSVAVIELENADANNVGVIFGAGETSFPEPFNLSGNESAFLGLAWSQETGGDPTSTTGDNEYFGDNRVLLAGRVDSVAGGDIAITGTSGTSFTYVAVSVDTLSLVPSVTAEGSLIPGQPTTISVSNFIDPLIGARITDSAGNVKELTLATQTSVSAPAVGVLDYVLYGDVTLEVYNATESATTTVAFNQPTGFGLVALEAGFVTTQESYLYNYGGTPAVPDQFTYDPIASDTGETLTLWSDGYWTSTGEGTWTIYGTDATDGFMESFPLIAGEGFQPEPVPTFPIFRGRRHTRQLLKNISSNTTGDWLKTSSTRDYRIVVEGTFDTATVKIELAIVDKEGNDIIIPASDLVFTEASGLVVKRLPENIKLRAVVESVGATTDINVYLTI